MGMASRMQIKKLSAAWGSPKGIPKHTHVPTVLLIGVAYTSKCQPNTQPTPTTTFTCRDNFTLELLKANVKKTLNER